jgi:hypothetical protein
VLTDAFSKINKGSLRGLMSWTILYRLTYSTGAPGEHKACRHLIVSVFAIRTIER